jgi:lipoprotein LprG
MRRLRTRATLLLLAAALTAVAAACTGPEEQLPDGRQLLRQSSQAMTQVDSARFVVDVQGTVEGTSMTHAEGQLTRDGDAQGTARLALGRQTTEIRFVIVDRVLYLQGPTGGFRQLPVEAATTVYDPSVVLDPQRGIPALLNSATAARTEAREEVNGVDAYRVSATLPGDRLAVLVPGATQSLTGQLWIAVRGSRLVQARFPLPGGTTTARLSEFDEPVNITPPPPG